MQETINIPKDVEYEYIHECDLCGSHDLCYWDSARSNTLSKCRKCGVVFTNPRLVSSESKDDILYSEMYFKQKSRMTPKLIGARKKTYAIEVDALSKYIKKGKILDVGCGLGIFLDAFNEKWEKYGCDISSYALEQATERGVKTFYGEFEKLDFQGLLFDVVYFRASLHHTFSPNKCLRKAFELLKPGGIVAVCMSNNRDGVSGRIFKAHVKSYEQAHNYLFSTKTLKQYLAQASFDIIEYSYPYFGTDYGSLSDWFQLMQLYGKYALLKLTGGLNKPDTYNFSSPPFYGNYINIYGRKNEIGGIHD